MGPGRPSAPAIGALLGATGLAARRTGRHPAHPSGGGGRRIQARAKKRWRGEPHPALRHYDPESFQEYFLGRPLEVLGRCWDIALCGGGWARDFASRQEARPGEAARLARELRSVLTSLGPSFVKLGQVLSSRVDLLPGEYVQELRSLTDQVAPFPVKDARRILEEDWSPQDVAAFASQLPSKPAASASLGQVYRVESAAHGAALAVKVQRPGVREQVCLDLFVLRSLAPWARRWLGLNTDLVALVDEYGERFVAELDYRLEANNAEEFQAAMLQVGLDSVCAPSPVHSLSTGRVLVTRWVEGERIDVSRGPAFAG